MILLFASPTKIKWEGRRERALIFVVIVITTDAALLLV